MSEEKQSLFEYDSLHRDLLEIEYIAGFDEAGRGPLAGPVACAGVILPSDYDNPLINDSKRLTDKKRRFLFEEIKKHALAYSIHLIDVETIDRINILEADRCGMELCLKDISEVIQPELIITDYMKLHTEIQLISIPKGDATSLAVAAASILAKVTRDLYMEELDRKYPAYGFKKNKGYGTKAHLEALKENGFIQGVHRLTFEPVKSMVSGSEQLKLF